MTVPRNRLHGLRVRAAGVVLWGLAAAAWAAPALGWMGMWPVNTLADLRVDLDSEEGAPARATLVSPPAGEYGTRSALGHAHLSDIHCTAGMDVVRRGALVVVPVGCGTLRWSFMVRTHHSATEYVPPGLTAWRGDAGSWWLVREESFLRWLRPGGAGLANIAFFLDGVPIAVRAGPSALPLVREAPGMWLLGDAVFVDRGDVRHFVDGDVLPGHLETVLDRHADAVAFLRGSLPTRRLSPVFWIGIASGADAVSGAAGTGLTLANFPASPEEFGLAAQSITLYVAVHEHAHQMFDGRGILWLSESVASYLALRAIRETAPAMMPVLAEAFLVRGRRAGRLLAELGEKAMEGDSEAYALIYAVGGAFWSEFDARMKESRRDLLQLLPQLLAEGFGRAGHPDPQVFAAITGVPREVLRSMFERFVASPDGRFGELSG